ncbi:hypothetical protein [Staphylococcus aureus]|nr:hypothetical protein [Staphylococcus aureus]HCV1026067.1 hypothetical protein [Staphylococcus aureus]HCV2456893.1 hypothetical protein [Staphylococcus aureus]
MFCYYKQHKGDNFSIEEVKNIIADNIIIKNSEYF